MPYPRPTQQHSSSAQASPRLLFISYSHQDMIEYGRDFMRYLTLMAKSADLGFAEEDIFFDRDRLKAGEDWDESIQAALERAAALIFLVSDWSLTSRYCVEREVGTAMRRGIEVIPVVLCECPWLKQLLPGDPQQRRFGALGGLPKDESFKLRPVKNWADRNQAWNSVVEGIAQTLRGTTESSLTSAPLVTRPVGAGAPPLLPYFCDQGDVERGFNHGVGSWKQSALLVFIKGTLDDRPPKFWDRLRAKNLANYLSATRKAMVLEQRPLTWPSAWDGARVRNHLETDVLNALSEAVTGNAFSANTPDGLSASLKELSGVRPLMATLRPEPIRALSASLRALLTSIESCPADAPLDRLVITFIVEADELIAQPRLTKALKLTGFARTQIVELDRLEELTREDVRFWYRDHEVNRYCQLDEEGMVAEVFRSADKIRLGPFAAQLKPVLGI